MLGGEIDDEEPTKDATGYHEILKPFMSSNTNCHTTNCTLVTPAKS